MVIFFKLIFSSTSKLKDGTIKFAKENFVNKPKHGKGMGDIYKSIKSHNGFWIINKVGHEQDPLDITIFIPTDFK